MSVFYDDLYGKGFNQNPKSIVANPLGLPSWAVALLVFAFSMAGMFFFGKIFKTWTPVFVTGALFLLLISPVLIRYERWIFWSWLVLYPIMYGFNLGPIVYILIPLTLPGAIYSLWRYRAAHGVMASHWITIPLWLFSIGLMCNILVIKQILRPDWLMRDLGFLLMTLYMVASNWKGIVQKSRHTRHLFFGLVGMGLFNGLVVCFQKLFHVGLVFAGGSTQMLRPMGILSHPNPAGFLIMLATVLVLYGFFSTSRPQAKKIYGGAMLLLMIACLFTMSKTSILQMIPILCLWTVLLPGRLKYQAIGLGLSLVAAIGFWSVFINQNAVLDSILRRFSQSDTLAIRQRYWEIVAEHMNWMTFIWGNGYRSASALLGEYNYNYALFQIDLRTDNGAGTIHCHNAYLKYIYELGFWGFGIFVTYALMLFKSAKTFIVTMSPRQKLANLAMASLLLLFLAESCTEILVLDHPYVVLYFSIAMLVLSVEGGWFESLNVKRGAEPVGIPG